METWSLKVFWKEKNTVIVVTDAKNDSANEGFPGGSDGKESACSAGDPGSVPGREDPLEEGMAIHSSILAWRTPWTEEPGGLQSMGSQTVEHDWVTDTFTFNSGGDTWNECSADRGLRERF